MAFRVPLVALERVGRNTSSRHVVGWQRIDLNSPHQFRLCIVCMGRNDGASGGKQRGSNRNRRQPGFAGPTAEDGLWYEDNAEVGPSSISRSGSGGGTGAVAPAPSQVSASTSGWERAGSLGGARSGARGRGRARGGAAIDDDEDEEDVRGWWQRPEERSLQAYANFTLEPWQEERLQRAYAAGRRKAQVQDLARELDVDRSVVLAWFKEFSMKPQRQREAVLAPLREQAAEAARREAAEAASGWGWTRKGKAVEAPRGTGGESAAAVAGAAGAPTNSGSTAKSGQDSMAASSSGFIPFYLRKQQERGGGNRARPLRGEVLRTLEAVYDRTPFPSADVIRGLFELHQLHRDVATEWFAARRAADGITSSSQKRTGRVSRRERDRDLQGAFGGEAEADVDINDDVGSLALPRASQSGLGLLAQLGAAAAEQQQQPEEPEEPAVVTLSRRELAALRSSLPSPTKHKGRQLAEKMGIKTGPGASSTQIGNVQYVEEVSAMPAGSRVRASWRYRASSGTAGGGSLGLDEGRGAAGRLRLRGRSRGPGGQRRGRSGGADFEEAEEQQ